MSILTHHEIAALRTVLANPRHRPAPYSEEGRALRSLQAQGFLDCNRWTGYQVTFNGHKALELCGG